MRMSALNFMDANDARRVLRTLGRPVGDDADKCHLCILYLYKVFTGLGLDKDQVYDLLRETLPTVERYCKGPEGAFAVSLLDNQFIHCTGDQDVYDLETGARTSHTPPILVSTAVSVSNLLATMANPAQ